MIQKRLTYGKTNQPTNERTNQLSNLKAIYGYVIRKLPVILQMTVYSDVERLRVEGEGKTEETWASDFSTARRGRSDYGLYKVRCG